MNEWINNKNKNERKKYKITIATITTTIITTSVTSSCVESWVTKSYLWYFTFLYFYRFHQKDSFQQFNWKLFS